jgi:hypothetical protein
MPNPLTKNTMTGWDKVFTTGSHTDSNGNKKVWTTADLDKIVDSLNPTYHEPPVVIGHPSDNAPAFGWVAAAKRLGSDLYLQYKDIAPEFKEWRLKGLFKKKSISVYPDGSLRHIGYLGGMPPAIKGLPDYAFSDAGRGQAVTYEFGDYNDMQIARTLRRLKNWLINKFGQEEADKALDEWDVQNITEEAARPDQPDDAEPIAAYNEPEEVQSMKPEDVEKVVAEKVTAAIKEFGEGMNKTVTALQATITELNKSFAAGREESQRREFREFLSAPDMVRRVADGSREATINQMVTLAAAEPVSFGEGDAKTTKPALDIYKDQLKALPEVVQFGEHATKDKVGNIETVNGMDAKAISDKAMEFRESETKAGRTITIADAVTHVTSTAAVGGAK